METNNKIPTLLTSITKDEIEELVTELQGLRTSLLIIRNGEDDAIGLLCGKVLTRRASRKLFAYRTACDALTFLFRKYPEYNVCKTCGACDGRCGITVDNDCLNCHHTREQGQFVLHAELDRTLEELARTGAILDI